MNFNSCIRKGDSVEVTGIVFPYDKRSYAILPRYKSDIKIKGIGTSIYDGINSGKTEVKVRGVVIGYPARKVGRNKVGGFNKTMYIQDDKAAVYVRNNNFNESYDSPPQSFNFNIGDIVEVSGKLTTIHRYFGINTQSTSDIRKTGCLFDVEPDDLTKVKSFDNGEYLRLVKVKGRVSELTSHSFSLITNNLGTIVVYDLTSGQKLDFDTYIKNGDIVNVVGILSARYTGDHIIMPRLKSDVSVAQ